MTLPPAITAAFRAQARACRDLGSPFTARLCDLIAGRLTSDTPVGAHIAAWPGDPGPSGTSVPLRLAGTLNRLRLSGDPTLTPAWPPHDVPDAALWPAIHTTLTTRAADVIAGLTSPPQTNEVRRSTALILAAHWLAARHPLPLILSEAGASAGLNLMFDRFALTTPDGPRGATAPALTLTPDWRGTAPPPPAPLTVAVADQRGVDLSPLDPRDPADRLRVMSYIWPDQPDRITLTEAAIAVAAPVDRADALDWLRAPGRAAPRPPAPGLPYHRLAVPARRRAGPGQRDHRRRRPPRHSTGPPRPPGDGGRRPDPRRGPHPHPLGRHDAGRGHFPPRPDRLSWPLGGLAPAPRMTAPALNGRRDGWTRTRA